MLTFQKQNVFTVALTWNMALPLVMDNSKVLFQIQDTNEKL